MKKTKVDFNINKAIDHLNNSINELSAFVVMSNMYFYKQDIDMINDISTHLNILKSKIKKANV